MSIIDLTFFEKGFSKTGRVLWKERHAIPISQVKKYSNIKKKKTKQQHSSIGTLFNITNVFTVTISLTLAI